MTAGLNALSLSLGSVIIGMNISVFYPVIKVMLLLAEDVLDSLDSKVLSITVERHCNRSVIGKNKY